MHLDIRDSALTKQQNRDLLAWLRSLEYRWGEADQQGQRPTGMVRDLATESQITDLIQLSRELWPHLVDLPVTRCYVNLFMPGEQPQWHRDGAVWTVLYYVTLEREPRMGGSTEFLDLELAESRSVLPQPGRALCFDGEYLHRAHSYPHQERFTIALKFSKISG